jgi:putative toxin-antitoxin system antitoxin component (TIGR02293 family)
MFDTPTTPTKDIKRFRSLLSERQPADRYAYAVLVGVHASNWPDLVQEVERGLPWKSFERFVENIGLRASDIAELIPLPARTLARRKREGRLQPDESERLLRLARIFARALELFDGDHDAASEWLTTRKIALRDAVPLELARTEIGASEVDMLIGRLEHGIFS